MKRNEMSIGTIFTDNFSKYEIISLDTFGYTVKDIDREQSPFCFTFSYECIAQYKVIK